jgi:hypothetical protein
LSDPAAAAASTWATSATFDWIGGVKITTTECTSSSAMTEVSASQKSSAEASALNVCGSPATSSPQPAIVSSASNVSASELLTIATRRPFGSGWCATN